MAGRQLGKLRQWAGEVISSREKTLYSDEFQEMERDIELRREGTHLIAKSCEVYHKSLIKKETTDDGEKMLPVDLLGVSMILHGEQLSEGGSDFGRSLVQFGRTHCKLATLQEAYALNLQESFIESLEKFLQDVKEYEGQRKKLDSRRLAYDSAISKAEKFKNHKKEKEKEKKEADEELERAKYRFEETTEDVRAHMVLIQEREAGLMRGLTNFLNHELTFAQKYLDSLKEIKADWPESASWPPNSPKTHKRNTSNTPTIKRKKSSASASSKLSSTRPKSEKSRPAAEEDAVVSDNDEPVEAPRSRRGSLTRKRRQSDASKSRSRPGSSSGAKEDKPGLSSRFSVSGVADWASNAVGGITGRATKDRDQFANLDEDTKPVHQDSDEEPEVSSSLASRANGIRAGISRRLSTKTKPKDTNGSSSSGSPPLPQRTLKSSSQTRIVHALYDFNGSSDELRFKAGDEIRVINEVLDDWWMGEVVGGNGKHGLFPTTFVSSVATSGPTGSDNESLSTREDPYDRQPMSTTSDVFNIGGLASPDAMSFTSLEETKGLMGGSRNSFDSQDSQAKKILAALDPTNLRTPRPPPLKSSSSDGSSSTSSTNGTSTKKAPPPPPPRRATNSGLSSPPIPARRPPAVRTNSSTSAKSFTAGRLEPDTVPETSPNQVDYDTSPFESAADLMAGKGGGRCRDFKQNPFKPKGLCSNCFQYHDV